MSAIRLTASSAHRWMQCTASPYEIRVQPGPPKREASQEIKEGIAFHWLMENVLKGKGMAPIGDVPPDGAPITAGMRRDVEPVLEYIGSLPGRLEVEKQREWEYGPIEIVSRPDATLVSDGVLDVIDYKYGEGVLVEPNRCEEALLNTYLLSSHSRIRLEVVRTTIYQPRIEHPDGALRSFTWSDEALRVFEDRLASALAEIEHGGEYRPSAHVCRGCPARPGQHNPVGCPAYMNLVATGIGGEIMDHKEILDLPDSLPRVPDLTPDQVSQYLTIKGPVMAWFEDLEAYAASLCEQGVNVPDFDVVPGPRSRRFTSEYLGPDGRVAQAKVSEILRQRYGLLDDEIAPRKMLSIAALEKRVKETGGDMDDMWNWEEGKPRLRSVAASPSVLDDPAPVQLELFD